MGKTYKQQQHRLDTVQESYAWYGNIDRLRVIDEGIPFVAIETIGDQINSATKEILEILDIAQTTYNKKKRENAYFEPRDAEIILLIQELIDFGIKVFDFDKEKFQRWIRKPNLSLGGYIPIQLFSTHTGIEEVRKALNRIEYGNFA